MELNSTTIARINNLLANPAKVGHDDEAMLASIIVQYPYFKPAHLLLARLTRDAAAVERAVLYSNGQVSYNAIHNSFEDVVEEVVAEEEEEVEVEVAVAVAEEEEVEVTAAVEVAVAVAEEEEVEVTAAVEVAEELHPDDQETFEEIGEFNSSEFLQHQSAIEPKGADADPVPEPVAIPETAEDLVLAEEEEILHWEIPEQVKVNEVPEIETVVPDEPEHAPVTKYDDDNLPYSFLWWLAKTRAAHRQAFQPYAAPKHPDVRVSNELQQQYVEHIFHLQTGLGENITGVENEVAHKEDELISAFLEKDPQIKPPPVDKLDNENKARKSAEDHNDVVSETLAAIYIEQTLYRKAIDTYEKLSLKFPEKSRYFADLIKSLEKKI